MLQNLYTMEKTVALSQPSQDCIGGLLLRRYVRNDVSIMIFTNHGNVNERISCSSELMTERHVHVLQRMPLLKCFKYEQKISNGYKIVTQDVVKTFQSI